MTKPTPIIDSAIRAACSQDGIACDYADPEYDCCGCPAIRATNLALRSACPKEMPVEWFKAMRFFPFGRVEEKDMKRQYENQPLWRELWAEDQSEPPIR
jgi:hypothetical protein